MNNLIELSYEHENAIFDKVKPPERDDLPVLLNSIKLYLPKSYQSSTFRRVECIISLGKDLYAVCVIVEKRKEEEISMWKDEEYPDMYFGPYLDYRAIVYIITKESKVLHTIEDMNLQAIYPISDNLWLLCYLTSSDPLPDIYEKDPDLWSDHRVYEYESKVIDLVSGLLSTSVIKMNHADFFIVGNIFYQLKYDKDYRFKGLSRYFDDEEQISYSEHSFFKDYGDMRRLDKSAKVTRYQINSPKDMMWEEVNYPAQVYAILSDDLFITVEEANFVIWNIKLKQKLRLVFSEVKLESVILESRLDIDGKKLWLLIASEPMKAEKIYSLTFDLISGELVRSARIEDQKSRLWTSMGLKSEIKKEKDPYRRYFINWRLNREISLPESYNLVWNYNENILTAYTPDQLVTKPPRKPVIEVSKWTFYSEAIVLEIKLKEMMNIDVLPLYCDSLIDAMQNLSRDDLCKQPARISRKDVTFISSDQKIIEPSEKFADLFYRAVNLNNQMELEPAIHLTIKLWIPFSLISKFIRQVYYQTNEKFTLKELLDLWRSGEYIESPRWKYHAARLIYLTILKPAQIDEASVPATLSPKKMIILDDILL